MKMIERLINTPSKMLEVVISNFQIIISQDAKVENTNQYVNSLNC